MIAASYSDSSPWFKAKLGFEASVKARLGWKGLKAEEYVEDGYIFLSTPNIKGRSIDFTAVNYITEDRYQESMEIALREGDVLLAKDGSTLGTVNVVRRLPAPSTVNGSIAVIRPQKNLHSVFLYYSLAGSLFQNFVRTMKDGMGVPHLFQRDIRRFVISFPSLPTQKAIANYLDRKTAAIDTLIEKKQKQLERLDEMRSALIHQAVTRGLDPDVPMKDSGIPWIGEIPAHWEVKRLKHLVKEAIAGPYGASLTKAMYTTNGYRVYGQQQVIPDDLTLGDYYISKEKFREMKRYEVFSGDILISVMGTIGRVAVVPEEFEPGIINPRLVRYNPKRDIVLPRFLQATILAEGSQAYLKLMAQGSTMDGLNLKILAELPITLPPCYDQNQIIKWLKLQQNYFAGVRQRIGEQIAKIQEYRQALITAAVTGQLDIPEEDEA